MIKRANFNFHSNLKELLDQNKRDSEIVCEFKGRQSVKHLIESLHIPHTEIGIILVNGQEVDFNYLVETGDLIDVYPLTSEMIARQNLPPRFLLDNHLGKLATYLRMLGFDTKYRNDFQDDELAALAKAERRILMTRDRGLLMRKSIQNGYFVRSMAPQEQVTEVIHHFRLTEEIKPFYRCLTCNEILQSVSKEDIVDRLQPLTIRYFQDFGKCTGCDKIYWKGSHYQQMESFIRKLLRDE